MRAVITSFHNYVPMYDHKYFNVISDYFFTNFSRYWHHEVDRLYILDSNWDLGFSVPKNLEYPNKIIVLKSDPNDRYYEAYKKVLPLIDADKILLMDNDMVVYRKGIVEKTFDLLDDYDVVSIYDTCGTYTTDKLNGKNKFCPYWFATKTDLLKKYTDIEWGPHMPHSETLGYLAQAMLDDGINPYEWEEDKTDEGKDLGYYHIRAGSTPAYLLTHRNFGDRQVYENYIYNQPANEILRQVDWYEKMGGDGSEIREDLRKKQ